MGMPHISAQKRKSSALGLLCLMTLTNYCFCLTRNELLSWWSKTNCPKNNALHEHGQLAKCQICSTRSKDMHIFNNESVSVRALKSLFPLRNKTSNGMIRVKNASKHWFYDFYWSRLEESSTNFLYGLLRMESSEWSISAPVRLLSMQFSRYVLE